MLNPKHILLEDLWSMSLIWEWTPKDKSHLREHENFCLPSVFDVVFMWEYAAYNTQKQGKFLTSSYCRAFMAKTAKISKGLSWKHKLIDCCFMTWTKFICSPVPRFPCLKLRMLIILRTNLNNTSRHYLEPSTNYNLW